MWWGLEEGLGGGMLRWVGKGFRRKEQISGKKTQISGPSEGLGVAASLALRVGKPSGVWVYSFRLSQAPLWLPWHPLP